MRRSWLLFILGIIVVTAACAVWFSQDIRVRDLIAENCALYWHQVLRMYPIILGSIVSAFLILLLEAWQVGWKQSSLYALIKPSKSGANDLFLWLFSLSQLGFIAVYLATSNGFKEIRPVIRDAFGLESTLLPEINSITIQIILYILLIDLIGYLHHIGIHHVPQFWVFHKAHHAATEFNGITAQRGHPVEVNFTAEIFFFIPFAIVGLPIVDVTIYVVIRKALTMLHHSRLDWDWGWFGKYVLISPHFHRIHHSTLPEHRNKNMGIIFSFWDHLFGTFCGDRIELTQLGVSDNAYNKKNVIHDFFLSFKEFWLTFKRPKSNPTTPVSVEEKSHIVVLEAEPY